MTKKRVAYIVTIVLAVMYITLGNRIVTKKKQYCRKFRRHSCKC